MQERKNKRFFNLQPSLAWRQLNGKKEDIKGEFTNEEMLEYVQRLCMLWLRTLKHLVLHVKRGPKMMANAKNLSLSIQVRV